MDRIIVYPGAIPQDTDVLNVERYGMNAIGAALSMAFDGNTWVDGLACAPTVPASMSVMVAPGRIMSMQPMDQNAFGSLPADATDLIYKCGINLLATTFALTAPTGAGQSMNYLIEAAFDEVDGNPVVLPYYNAANPAQPYQGPAGGGAAQDTTRKDTVALQLIAGAAANTGTQVTPPVTPGYFGLWVITVNYGQSSVTSTSIAEYAGAPFVPLKLPEVPAAIQAQAGNFSTDMGAVNALAVTLTPAPVLLRGLAVRVMVAFANTLQPTLSLNGGTPVYIYNPDYTPVAAGQLGALGIYTLVYNGNVWVLQSISNYSPWRGMAEPFTSSGTFTVPTGITRIRVRLAGGGAAGGGGSTTFSGAGGGAGGYSEGIYTVTPGTTYPVTVGMMGLGTAGNGGNGGTTSFGALLSATGGDGGAGYGADNSSGGQGGNGMGGNVINLAGGWGGDGVETSGMVPSGHGGASYFGGGGRAGAGGGEAGYAYGSGGGGDYSAAAWGGAGASGCVIVEW